MIFVLQYINFAPIISNNSILYKSNVDFLTGAILLQSAEATEIHMHTLVNGDWKCGIQDTTVSHGYRWLCPQSVGED